MSKTKLLAAVLWALALASVAAYLVARAGADDARPDPQSTDPVAAPVDEGPSRLFAVEAFELTDHNNKPFSSRSLNGTVWVGFVFLTECPTGACPVMINKMSGLQEALADEPVHFVSVSIDPATDTPERLREYVEQSVGSAPGERWHLLTADSQAETLAVARKLKLGVDVRTKEHGTQFLLVDADGFVRGVYGNSDPKAMDQLATDAKALVAAGGR
jgi:protein SCO1/2